MNAPSSPGASAPESSSVAPVTDPYEPGWRRPRPTRAELRNDAVLAAVLFVGAVLASQLYRLAGIFDEPAAQWITLIWCVALTVPLAWRRRHPATVAVIVSATFIVGGEMFVPEVLVSNIALFVALYTVGAWVDDRRRAFIVRAVIIAAMLAWLVIHIFRSATDPETLERFSGAGALSPFVALMLIQVLTNLLYFGGSYYFGDAAYASARQRAALEQRTCELERERERTAAQAVALERLRIARELHDVVAHHVSVMGVQAGAARTVLASDPDGAREAIENVEAGARTAIDELHRLLNTLRESAPEAGVLDPRASDSASTVGIQGLRSLAEESTSAGLPTRFEVIGEPRPVSALVGLNLYRIAQEALTNARKYAGPGATADIRLRYLDTAIELEVVNTGTVPFRPRPGGLGHVGMRERVDAMDGSLEIGPRARGGYLVRASVPRQAAERMPSDRGIPGDHRSAGASTAGAREPHSGRTT